MAGAAVLPSKGGQAGGAGGLVETCPALRNRWSRLRPHLGQKNPSNGHDEPLQKGIKMGYSSLPAAFLTIPYLFLNKTATKIAVQFSVEFSRFGEYCRMFQSWQLHLTA